MKSVKWGIVGTGTIAKQFASDFRYVKDAELVAVASRTQNKADAFAKASGVPNAHSTYEALFRDPNVDCVYIATPHNFHYSNSWDAITHGKAVLCEKPLTINSGEAISLTNYAKSQGVYLMEGMWTYFLPAIRKAKEWVAQGRIGKLTQVKADFGYSVGFDPQGRMYNPELAGGALLDMGIYPIAAACLFIGEKPERIEVIGRRAITGVDDEVSMLLDFGESHANLATSFRSKLFNHLFIIGTEGTIQIPNFWQAKTCELFVGDEKTDHFEESGSSVGFNHEIDAVSLDVMSGRLESETVSHARSIAFQSIMEKVLGQF